MGNQRRNGANHGEGPAAPRPRALAQDARAAILFTEGAMVDVLDVGPTLSSAAAVSRAGSGRNAFGEPVVLEAPADATPAVRVEHAARRAAEGKRVGLVATARELATAREALELVASQRLGIVVHAVEPAGPEAALALADLGWALLFASDVEESVDLTLVARRAAEDSGTPFVVVHDLASVRHVEPLAPLDARLLEAYVGPPRARVRKLSDPAHPFHAQVGAHGFAERAPFAVASALRELESLTGRRRDVLTRSGAGEGADAPLQLVALGALGDVLLGEVPRLRSAGYDVGAVKVTSFRPFPGSRAVRLLARSLAVTVLEHTDQPFAQSNPLARELKAAFADALTWAPGYPGVGRIPRIHGGVVRAAAHELEAGDLDAVVQNMLEGEQGKRFFVLGDEPSLPPAPTARTVRSGAAGKGGSAGTAGAGGVFHARGLLRDAVFASSAAEVCTAVVAGLLSLKVRASVVPLSPAEGGGVAFDLVAGRDRPRGVHRPTAVELVIFEDLTALVQGNPLARLGREGTVAVPARALEAEGVWGALPPYAKAIVSDRQARVVGWAASQGDGDGVGVGVGEEDDEARWTTAATFAGVLLATLANASQDDGPPVDASRVEQDIRDVVEVLTLPGSMAAGRAGAVGRRAFESLVVVPRAVVDRDEASVHLGRMDARAAFVA